MGAGGCGVESGSEGIQDRGFADLISRRSKTAVGRVEFGSAIVRHSLCAESDKGSARQSKRLGSSGILASLVHKIDRDS